MQGNICAAGCTLDLGAQAALGADAPVSTGAGLCAPRTWHGPAPEKDDLVRRGTVLKGTTVAHSNIDASIMIFFGSHVVLLDAPGAHVVRTATPRAARSAEAAGCREGVRVAGAEEEEHRRDEQGDPRAPAEAECVPADLGGPVVGTEGVSCFDERGTVVRGLASAS